MKGLLLDVYKQEVREIDCASDIHEWYKLLNCDIVEMPERYIAKKRYTIICDEEGLLKPHPVISAISHIGDIMLVGSLLIFNTDYDNCDVKSLTDADIKHIRKHIRKLRVWQPNESDFKELLLLTSVGTYE